MTVYPSYLSKNVIKFCKILQVIKNIINSKDSAYMHKHRYQRLRILNTSFDKQ